MIDHTPTPDDYYSTDLQNDSPLTDAEREAFRDRVRKLVLGIREEDDVRDLEHPTVNLLELTSFRDTDRLSVTVHLDLDELDTEPTANESFDQDGTATTSAEMHYLRDLGDEWEALEYDVLSQLVHLLDLPEFPSELANWLVDGDERGPCLLCDLKMPGSVSFSVIAVIPEHTQKVYDNAEFELARQYRIPIDGVDTSELSDSEE